MVNISFWFNGRNSIKYTLAQLELLQPEGTSSAKGFINQFCTIDLQIDVIPVVLGRRNGYERYAPPYSYIQADQFDSPHELAAYLYALDKDDAAYQKYVAI